MATPLDKYKPGDMIRIVSFEEKTRGIFKQKDDEIQELKEENLKLKTELARAERLINKQK